MEEKKEESKNDLVNDSDPLGIIKETMDGTLLKPVQSRIRTRIKQIEKISKAVFSKIPMGNSHYWNSKAPKIHITPIQAGTVNGVGTINYQCYRTDKNGNKVAKEIKSVMPNSGKEVVIDASYIIEKEVVETIELRKPIKREVHTYETK